MVVSRYRVDAVDPLFASSWGLYSLVASKLCRYVISPPSANKLSARRTPQYHNPSKHHANSILQPTSQSSQSRRRIPMLNVDCVLPCSEIARIIEVTKYLTSQNQEKQASQESLRELLGALAQGGWTFNSLLLPRDGANPAAKLLTDTKKSGGVGLHLMTIVLPSGHMLFALTNQNNTKRLESSVINSHEVACQHVWL
jgi:hypothetical protein